MTVAPPMSERIAVRTSSPASAAGSSGPPFDTIGALLPDPVSPLALSLNENPFPSLPEVRSALIASIDAANRYPVFLPGRMRSLIAAHIGVQDDQVVLGAGATDVIVLGASLFGAGEGLLVGANLGNSPWTVLAQGASVRTGLPVGVMTNVIGLLVLALWIPLRQRPGLGTVSMVLIVGTSMDLTLAVLPEMDAVVVGLCTVIGGILITAIGTGYYLGSALGPGPRDGLMTGLHRLTGRSLGWTRAMVEISVLAAGIVLGGTVGVGPWYTPRSSVLPSRRRCGS